MIYKKQRIIEVLTDAMNMPEIANALIQRVINDLHSREWQGLGTDEEILELSKDAWGRDKLTDGRTDLTGFYVDFARLIEKLLQEKNT